MCVLCSFAASGITGTHPRFHVPLFLQLHVLSGLTIFALLPFTRLVHIFSVPLSYVTFPFTIYRRRWGGV